MALINLMSEIWDHVKQIRMHGRGGQGAALASTILALAAFKEGKFVNSFPSFGSERRGAPVATFVKISDEEFMPRCKVYHPDILVIFDYTLMEISSIFDGLKEGGMILANVPEKEQQDIFEQLKHSSHVPKKVKVFMVDANAIAIQSGLGGDAIPAINAVMLGAFIRMMDGMIHLNSLIEALQEKIPANIDKNIIAAKEAYERLEEIGVL